jgi:hypothetical protein
MAAKVRDAAIATTMVQRRVDRAVGLLEEHDTINALGVLMYPSSRRAALLEAATQITKAAQLTFDTKWPTESARGLRCAGQCDWPQLECTLTFRNRTHPTPSSAVQLRAIKRHSP